MLPPAVSAFPPALASAALAPPSSRLMSSKPSLRGAVSGGRSGPCFTPWPASVPVRAVPFCATSGHTGQICMTCPMSDAKTQFHNTTWLDCRGAATSGRATLSQHLQRHTALLGTVVAGTQQGVRKCPIQRSGLLRCICGADSWCTGFRLGMRSVLRRLGDAAGLAPAAQQRIVSTSTALVLDHRALRRLGGIETGLIPTASWRNCRSNVANLRRSSMKRSV